MTSSRAQRGGLVRLKRSEAEIIEELEALAAVSDEDVNYDDILGPVELPLH